jgi:hypothetical protein
MADERHDPAPHERLSRDPTFRTPDATRTVRISSS